MGDGLGDGSGFPGQGPLGPLDPTRLPDILKDEQARKQRERQEREAAAREAAVPARPTTGAKVAKARERLGSQISAYPGSVTYLDLMRKNQRQSVVLVAAMILLAAVVGSAIGMAIVASLGHSATTSGGPGRVSLLPSLIMGGSAGLMVAILTSLWSWFSGDKAILRMSGAHEISAADDQVLWNVVDEMRIAAGLPMPRVYLIDDTALNAFATGRDAAHASVAITKGLRGRLNREELQSVIAHEVAHVRHMDIRFSMLMATMVGLIVFATDAFLRIAFHSGRAAGRSSRKSDGGGGGAAMIVLLVIAVLLAIIAPLAAKLIQLAYSRQREYLADAGAVELTRNPEGLASALSTLSMDPEPLVEAANRGTAHMFIVNPLRKMRESHQALDSLFASHPPLDKRIARILALAR